MICDPFKIALREGLRPQAYTILAQRADHLVAKMETAHGIVLFKANTKPGDMVQEAANIRLLDSAEIPVPEILTQGEDPLSYLFLKWIDGIPLSSSAPLAAQLEIGRLLHRIHDLDLHPPYERPYPWAEWMRGWLAAVMSWWQTQQEIAPETIEAVWQRFEQIRPLFNGREKQFMLQDGRPEHVLVRDDRIVGIIDLHDAQGGDGGMDLGVMGVFDQPLLATIRKGYPASPTETQILDQLIPFYTFIRRLSAAEWNAQHGSPALSQKALALAQKHPLANVPLTPSG